MNGVAVQKGRAPRGGNLSGAQTNNHTQSIANKGEEVKMNDELKFVNRLSEVLSELPNSGDIDVLSIMLDFTNRKRPVANVWLYHCIERVEERLGKTAQLEVHEGTEVSYLYKTLKCCNGTVILEELMGEIGSARA